MTKEIRREHIEKMGNEIGTLFYGLHNEFIYLRLKWKEYQTLFIEGKNRVEVLNKTAPLFFYNVQRMMTDDISVSIARMIESGNSSRGKSKNATLLQLIHQLEDEDLKTSLMIRYSFITKNIAKVILWRNKKVAHRDFELHTREEENAPIIGLTPKDIRLTLEAIQKVFEDIYQHFFKSHYMYDYIEPQNAALSLLHYLDLGKRAEKERINVLKSGKLSNMDFAHIENRSFE